METFAFVRHFFLICFSSLFSLPHPALNRLLRQTMTDKSTQLNNARVRATSQIIKNLPVTLQSAHHLTHMWLVKSGFSQLWVLQYCYWLAVKQCPTPVQARSPPGSSVHGISQARIVECVAISQSRGLSCSRDRTCISCIGRWDLYR